MIHLVHISIHTATKDAIKEGTLYDSILKWYSIIYTLNVCDETFNPYIYDGPESNIGSFGRLVRLLELKTGGNVSS